MGLVNLTSILILVIATGGGLVGYFFLRDGELPTLPDENWGLVSSQELLDGSIRNFAINISEQVLQDLKARLILEVKTFDERVEPSMAGTGFHYGINSKFLKNVLDHWLHKYDWRKREKVINKWPGFKTRISGLDIYFRHIKPTKETTPKKKVLPLLLLHGWPGSFVEHQKIIEFLVEGKNSDFRFELIIPSYPGFPFSEGSKKPGMGATDVSLILLKLMKRLGHEQFYVQGGDWGSIIGSNMATLFHEKYVCIMHCKIVAHIFPTWLMDEDEVAQHSPLFYKWPIINMVRETGYMHLHATKPDTLGVALSNSPGGHAAYFLERYSWWTNQTWIDLEDGGINSAFDLDELLDNIMVYWVGKSITTSMRMYRETSNLLTSHYFAVERVAVKVPVSCINLAGEPYTQPKFSLVEKFPRLRYTKWKTGGHFNPLQIPDVVAKDVIEAINFMHKTYT
ncbi:juvenile hormone epoxide hydrolase 2 isoform X2 [Folsomia candida]|uniref:juvenile hormone epoxide hydrolase 2 isoform X2 n=1 Tax=Folsomia candida TaxID=158441 RepID=UPI000B902306|nr:juvenile hormone epoxide hydrolase 2 isoform X2 [Folsomia candida]